MQNKEKHSQAAVLGLQHLLAMYSGSILVPIMIAGALGYLVLPIDIVPDTIPVLGWIDDVAVLGLAFKVANRYIKTRHQEEAKKYFPFGGSN